jgi:uncharacterized protein involved in exopolysaccharide biosynthesis/Mrp family chromosome partitioning ATPase
MLDYGQTADDAPDARSAPEGLLRPRVADLLAGLGLIARNKALILGLAAACGLAGFVLSNLLTPSYVATAQIYVDPRGSPGADRDGTPPGQDSNGFINYVESLSLIITSRTVLERVVATEKLDRDDEFAGSYALASGTPPGASQGDKSSDESMDAAVRALGARINVRRPERTFVIDLSVRSRDPEKAARLASATARAFIEVQSAMQSDSARKATVSLDSRIEALRSRVMAAEKRVEDFKAQNGLVSTHEQLVTEQQLAETNQQLTAARERVEEARSRYDQIAAARNRGGDIGAIAEELNLASLTPLRAQQAEARQKLADLSTELGPRHPLVKDAEARVREADHTVDAELSRVAEAGRSDYARAKETEASLSRQLDSLRKQTLANGQTSVGLRDLEREADAARNLYELFVTRSRQTGDIQQVDADAPSVKIISTAATPIQRSFPPSSSLMSLAGVVLGLAAGIVLAAVRERLSAGGAIAVRPAHSGEENPSPDEPSRTAAPPTPFVVRGQSKPTSAGSPPFVAITQRSRLERRASPQSLARIDLAGLGFATLQSKSDSAEFRDVFAAFDLFESLRKPGAERRSIAVVGNNRSGQRSALAINLALTAAGEGFRPALIDTAAWNSRLTRAVRQSMNSSSLAKATFVDTANGVLLSLPKCHDEAVPRIAPVEALNYLLNAAEEELDLVICDGPGVSDPDSAAILSKVDDIILLEADSPALDGESQLTPLGPAAAKVRAIVGFDASLSVQRRERAAL